MTTSTFQLLDRPEETGQVAPSGDVPTPADDAFDWDVVDVMEALLSLET